MLDLEGTGIPKQMSEEFSVTKKKKNRKHHNFTYIKQNCLMITTEYL